MMCSKSESRGVAGSQEAYSVHQRPIEECLTVAGKGPIGTRWVDTNKGDEVSPEYRSRWFAQDIKRDRRDDFFAATLHLEAKQALPYRPCTPIPSVPSRENNACLASKCRVAAKK